ncbi:MAG: heavy-metal-associated domain-containing protein, partial [Candidatus Thermoplasmatota archaeon]|nr:heavy-metal-associated domain-containing protein [Candidatus Thermoplasmatota archaeon]
MTCGGCAGNVQRALEAVGGVTSADVNHVEGNANIAHWGVDKSDLEDAITGAGYSVGETAAASGLHQLGSPSTGTA